MGQAEAAGAVRIRELHPAGGEALENLERASWEAVDPDLLRLCRDHAAAMLRGEDADPSPELGARERAYLEFTEQFVVSVSSVSEQQVNALLDHSSPDEVYAFAYALYAQELNERVGIVAAEVLR